MTTEKLFWEDPYQKEFDAKVLKISGNGVVLDRTCFYPMGGGQVGDTGEINGIRVVDTRKDENDDVIHVLEREPDFSVGDVVHGKIDWERRYKIMRLHSAAHINYHFMKEVFPSCDYASSGIVDEKKDRLDYLFDQPIDREKLKLVEQKTNEFIQQGKEIKTFTDEAGRRHWDCEMMHMFCCGTHVKNTKEIGRIVVVRGDKPGKGKERIEITLSG
jgi:Ser-tRNA(Ala) deacylase AlaX